MIDAAKSNFFAPPGAVERIERELMAAACGPVLALIRESPRWMLTLGDALDYYGFNNDSVVLIGAEDQLYLCDDSPLARLGETEHNPGVEEFPISVYRRATTSLRMRPSPLSPHSPGTMRTSPTTWTTSPSPRPTSGEGGA